MVYCKCCVKGCTTTSLKKSVVLFDVPTSESLLVKWQEKVQTNDGRPLTFGSKVCELHFSQRSIRKEIVSHRNYKNSLRSVLSKNAIPTLNLMPTPDEKSVNAPSAEPTNSASNDVQAETVESAEAVNSSAEPQIMETSVETQSTNGHEEVSVAEASEAVDAEILDDSEIVLESELVSDQAPSVDTAEVINEATEEVTLALQEEAAVVEDEIALVSAEQPTESTQEITQEMTLPVSEEPADSEQEGATLVLKEDPENLAEEGVPDSAETTSDVAMTSELEEMENQGVPDSTETTSDVVMTSELEEAENQGVPDSAEMTSDVAMTSELEEAENAENTASEADPSSTISIVENSAVSVASPANINVKDAAVEAGRLDVLVCGNCHTVFHFIEEFQAHKNAAACNETSSLKSNITEPKPQVWAFLIWKNSQIEDGSSWKLYQRWCQMSDVEKSVWVAAGARLQECAALSRLKNVPKEISEKITLNKPERKAPVKAPVPTVRTFSSLSETKYFGETAEAVSNVRTSFDGDAFYGGMDDGDFRIKEEVTSDGGEESIKPRKLKKHPKPAKTGTSADDEDDDSDEEYSVERIVARRYNQKKKQFEYLLKWEGYPSDQNTWEPAENLATCQHLLKAYEANLAKMQQQHKGVKNVTTPDTEKKEPEQGRPVRNSKQRALTQVREWCGSMKNDDSGKRRASDSADDEVSFSSKRIKQEKDETYSPNKSVNRNDSKSAVNGVPERKQVLTRLAAELGIIPDDDQSPKIVGNSVKPVIRSISSFSQQNQEVLVASAKGVVKVDPSQVPNLSSGVYIMSNKSGIVKLDSLSPQKALSSLRKTGVLPQTSKGGVVVLQTPSQKGLPRSGIVPKSQVPQKLQDALPFTKVPAHRSILPRSPFNSSARPAGVLRPAGTSTPRPLRPIVPRMPSILSSRPPPLSKIQFPPLRPRGIQAVGRPSLGPQKDKLKPIQSILGSALLASEDKAASLKAKSGAASASTPTNQSIMTGTTNQTSKSAALKKSASKISKTQAGTGAKLVDNDKILMEFQAQSDSDSDYGLEDNFPSDLPPLESIENSPPRPLTLDPSTGERLMKAEGERTPSPEPTPPPTPPPKTPEPPLSSESTDTTETLDMTTEQGTFIKVEMSPGGTTGMVTEASSVSQEEALEFATLGDECDVSGLRVKKILSPASELEQQRIVLEQQEHNSMEGVESGGVEVEDSIIHVTGEDGTVYQVSSSQLNGDTLLLSDGGEGAQQCVFVTEDGGDGTVVALDPSQYVNTVGEMESEQVEMLANSNTITIESGEGEDQAQVVAQLVEAGEPTGGGLRKVVLMLPDGNLMMTEVDEEQFAALELDK